MFEHGRMTARLEAVPEVMEMMAWDHYGRPLAVTVRIDHDALAGMILDAANNATKRSKHGPISVKVRR